MSNKADPPEEDKLQEKVASTDDRVVDGVNTVDSMAHRLQSLVIEYARDRAVLAERISQLEEENYHHQQRIKMLELRRAHFQDEDLEPLTKTKHPKRDIGLDFSLPKRSGKR
tara:strand:- start:419 stop:754 length:336 start_codon:yes stop_codon:yes gene_type:complete